MIMLLFNFGMVAAVFGNVMSVFGASDKIAQIFFQESKINSTGGDTIPDKECRGVLELKDVHFRYPTKDDVEVLKGVSLKVDN